MGLFARFVCLRRDSTANDLGRSVRDLLQARNVAETTDPAAAERLLLIAPAGDGWLMVVDHVEHLSEAIPDRDGLLAELGHSPCRIAVDIVVADSDDLILSLIDERGAQFQLEVGHDGLKSGALEPWQCVLVPGQSTEDIRKAFAKRTTFVEEHFPKLKALFGIDFSALREIDTDTLQGRRPLRADAVLLRLKAVPAPGQIIGPPKLLVDEVQRQNIIRNRAFPQIPRGLVTHFPAFCFQSRGGGARGLEVRLAGSAQSLGLIEIVSAKLVQRHPIDPNRNRDVDVVPEMTASGTAVRFPDLEVADWMQPELRPPMRVHGSPQDLRVFVYCRALKAGDGELEAEARLVSPSSAPTRTSCPVTVLPDMWRPLRSSEQPTMIYAIRMLNRPTRLNGLAVLQSGAEEEVSALRQTLQTWRSLIDPGGKFTVAAATEQVNEASFFCPADPAKTFTLDFSKKRQTKWNRLLADLPSVRGLQISSEFGSHEEYDQRYEERILLHYISAATHPRLPQYAARMAQVSLSLPANAAAELALVSLMQAMAAEGIVRQAYVAAWDGDDGPQRTLYERAADIDAHQLVAEGWGTCYLRAVADRLWLGTEFATNLPDRAALERVAIVNQIGNTLAIERRSEAALRDLERCLEPMLASQAESRAFRERFMPARPIQT